MTGCGDIVPFFQSSSRDWDEWQVPFSSRLNPKEINSWDICQESLVGYKPDGGEEKNLISLLEF
jgi:hypothetical protein